MELYMKQRKELDAGRDVFVANKDKLENMVSYLNTRYGDALTVTEAPRGGFFLKLKRRRY